VFVPVKAKVKEHKLEDSHALSALSLFIVDS
jgi:hypothetical protein